MPKFPLDIPKGKVIKTLEHLGFRLVREVTTLQCFEKILTELELLLPCQIIGE